MAKTPTSLADLKKKSGTPAPSAAGPTNDGAASLSAAIGAAKGGQLRSLLIGLVAVAGLLVAGLVFYVLSTGLAVKILPEDAGQIGYVTLERGLGWVSDDGEVFVLGSRYQIGVHADSFISTSVDVTPDTAQSYIEVTLKPVPAQLVLKSDPALEDTRWYLDGALEATRADLALELEPGDYQVTADHPYFEPATRTVTLRRAEEKTVVIPLSRVQGELALNAAQQNATVILDDGAVAQLPHSSFVAGGKHRVVVQAPGHVPITDQIEVTNTQRQIRRNYRLEPVQSTLQVNVQPATARITLDGRSIQNGAVTRVDAGREYRLAVTQKGFVTDRRRLVLEPGQAETVDITLAEARGTVSFVSRPAGAELFIDGVRRGRTPVTLSLQTLPKVVEMQRPGYRTATARTVPERGKTTTVNLILRTELEARLRELPPVMLDRVGLELVRFKPDKGAFTIGAERGDIGQRANEILRQMQLTKHFYASKYEITVGQYRKFAPNGGTGSGNTMPVTGISWEQAAAYCNWLSAQNALTPFYAISGGQVTGYNIYADGYRLPTEAEWEWLARKARRPDMTPFAWGTRKTITKAAGNLGDESAKNTIPTYIPRYSDGYAAAAPVGSFAAELSGLHDMSGNVREWVNDRYAIIVPNKGDVAVNFFGPTIGEGHVVKGSSFKTADLTYLRAASRDRATGPADDIGFRVVRYVYGAEDR